jgi:hypothetical protein
MERYLTGARETKIEGGWGILEYSCRILAHYHPNFQNKNFFLIFLDNFRDEFRKENIFTNFSILLHYCTYGRYLGKCGYCIEVEFFTP